MMEDWINTKISEITSKLTKGTTPSTYGYNFEQDGEINFIRAEGISKEGYVDSSTFLKISKECDKKLKRSKIQENDILFSIAGMALGKSGIAKKEYLPANTNQAVAILRPNEKVYPFFLLYYIVNPSFYKLVNSVSGQAAQPNINLKQIGLLPINLPPLPTQRKIASILSAYDDLIENNLKRIKLLEEKAQLTYEEWFVRMKFPGHETAPINPKTGLPEGWEKKTLDYLCEKITDGTHDSPKAKSEGYKLITGKHINNGFVEFESAYLISKEDHENIKKRSGIDKGDLLFSNIGTLGNIGVVTEDFEYSCKNVIIFKFKRAYNTFLFSYLSDDYTRKKLDAQSSGVAQKFYSLNLIRNYKDHFPDVSFIINYDKAVGPLIKLKFDLQKQNQLLKQARDILLPRLMTGMVDVDSLEIETLKPSH